MGLFDIAILVAPPGGIRVGPDPIVVAHLPIPLVEGSAAGTQLVGCRRQIICPVHSGDSTQFPHRGLKPADQGLKTLRVADLASLPIRVWEDKVVEEVIERLPAERDAQRPQ